MLILKKGQNSSEVADDWSVKMIRFFIYLFGVSLTASEAPSLSEYIRAKEALKLVLPRGRNLPKAVRLGI